MITKRLCTAVVLCALGSPGITAVAGDELANARGLLLGGKYAEAAEIYAALAEKDPAAVLGLARCLSSQGKTDEAVERLAAAADGHAELHAELARLAFLRGDYPTAKSRAEQSLRIDADQLLARWIRAELERVAGRLEEAEAGYRRLIDFYNDHQVRQAESLCWIGRAAARYARWNRLSDQFHFLVAKLYPRALKLEPDYWPAHYEAGLLFLEKHNRADAEREFQAALQRNPNAAEVHVAMARLAMAGRDVEQAEASIRRALEINPGLLSGWLGKADLLWANFQTQETLRLLQQKALPLSPLNEETLGRVAACYLLLDGMPGRGATGRFPRLVEQVSGRNPHAGGFFFRLAVQLEDRNRLSEAKRFFLETVRVMPQKIGPRSHLGLLHMRCGDETTARKVLDEALAIDPFNLRVTNTLEVLDVLETMATLRTEQVVLKYDGQRDKLLARSVARQLETVYPEWCQRFGYRPPQKPLLEIFNQARGHSGQKWFSTRMIGLPHLGPVAASTGWMVAMASPNDPGMTRRFNWARVLKHEMVHVITLQQTGFNIPHWYTEGLAVFSEGCPRPARWNQLLVERVPAKRLFDLRTINAAFTRAQSSDDWQLAYCQSELYVDYMRARWGAGGQQKLLQAYTEGADTPEAIRRALGVSQEEFERGYVAYLEKLTAELTVLRWPSPAGLADLLKAHRERPEDPDAAAELAYAYLRRGADKEALELAGDVLGAHPKHQLATYVLARRRLDDGRTRDAIRILEECLDRRCPQPNALNLLAGLKLKAELYDEAAELYALGERLDSVNPRWTKSLGRLYLLSNNRQKLAETLARLAEADADDLPVRKKLAQMALDRRDYAAAADWANQACEIDVMDAEAHGLLGQALAGRHDYDRAVEELQIAVELDPSRLYPRFALADACVQAKRTPEARKVLRDLLRLAPDYPGVALMLEGLEEGNQP